MSFFSFYDFAEADIDREEYEAWQRHEEKRWLRQELEAIEHFQAVSLAWFKREVVA